MTDVQSDIARVTEEIAAPPDEVFDALLDPDALAEWFAAPDGVRTRDWTVEPVEGGSWRATTVAPDGTEGLLAGDVQAIDAPRLLELRWHVAPGDADGSRVRFDLEPIWRNGERATRITVTHVTSSPLASRVMMGANRPLAARGRLAPLPSHLVFALRAHLASLVTA